MSETLRIDLEFLRADKVSDPYGMRFGAERYLLRRDRGQYGEAMLEWGGDLLTLLAELQKPRGGAEKTQRMGERLREILRPAGWERHEAAIVEAVRERRPIRITFVSAAAELYALPWELVTVMPTGEPLCQLPDCLIQYEWPGVPRTAAPPDAPPARRVLFAWSGSVPAGDHLRELTRTLNADPDRPAGVVRQVAQVSRESLREALAGAAAAGEPFAVLHILCHGVVRDDIVHLVWRSVDGDEEELVDPNRLRALLGPFAASLELVVLCACNAGQAGALGSRLGSVALALHRGTADGGGIASVVASRFPLSVTGSTTMTRAFYATLWSGGVRRALVAARDALSPAVSAEAEHRIDHASLLLFTLPRETSGPTDDDDAAAEELRRELDAELDAAATTSSGAEVGLFIGRETQLARLETWLERAAAGQTQAGFVVGDPGSGKTALLREFASRALAAPSSPLLAVGHCDASTGEGDAYAPFIEIVTQLTGGVDIRPTEGILRSEHATLLRRQTPTAIEALVKAAPHLIGPFLSAPALAARTVAIGRSDVAWAASLRRAIAEADAGEGLDKAQLFRECTALLSTLARERPLILIVEDLHWADDASISLFLHLALKVKERRILLLGSFRTNEVALDRGGERHPLASVRGEIKRALGDVEVDLDALGEDERRAFAHALIDSEPNDLGVEFREALLAHTGGHPLFTIELLRTLQERGDLAKDEQGRWSQGPGLDWADLPARVEGVIEERILRLEQDMRDLLDVASVEGPAFTAQVVGRVQKVDDRELLRSLSRDLESRHHLVTAGTTVRLGRVVLSQYSFTNGLFRQYLYEELPEALRISIHGEIAGILEELYKERTEQVAVQLAHHHDFAGNTERAVDYYLVAGKRALHMSAYSEARRSLRRALTLLASLPEDAARDRLEIELRVPLATVEKATQGWASAEAKAQYDRTSELFARAPEHPLRSSALLGMWAFYLVRGDLRVSASAAEQLLRLAEQTKERDVELAARLAVATSSFWLGELRTTREQADALGRLYDAGVDAEYRVQYGQDPLVTVSMVRAWATWLAGLPATALRDAQENVARAERLDHPFSLAIALTTLAWLHQHMHDVDATAEVAERLVKLARERNFPSYVGLGVMLRGWADAMQGRDADGVAGIEAGFAVWSATSGQLALTFTSVLLAEAHLHAGRLDAAGRALEIGLTAAREHEERPYGPELWRLQGERLAASSPDEATTCLRRAIAEAEELGAVMLVLRAAMSLATIAAPEVRSEARQKLAQVYAGLTEGHDLPEIAAVRRRIEEDHAATEPHQDPLDQPAGRADL